MNLSLRTLRSIPYMDAVGFEKARSKQLTGVSTDSRSIGSGNLFVALRGEKFNGHNFVSAALERGARALLVDAAWAKENGRMVSSAHVPVVIVEETTRGLGDLAREHRRDWGRRVVAVAGSNGKTTTKEMVAAVLGRKYHVLATEGNLNNHIGVPLTLLRLQEKHDVAVIEFGTNHPGEIAYLCGVSEPTHGLITNIGREHLEFFGGIDGVAEEEGALFDWLAGRGGNAIVNKDDSRVVKRARRVSRKVSYGVRNRSADIRATSISVDGRGNASFDVVRKGKRPVAIQLETPGVHSAGNALAAFATGAMFAVPVADIVEALHLFRAPSKRMQIVDVNGVTILDDTYNSNPDSVRAALETLGAMETTGKRIAVLADMLELGPSAEEAHRTVGSWLKEFHVDYALTYGPLSRLTNEHSTARVALHYDQKNVLSEYLSELVSRGDVVLVKGSRGMKMEDVVMFLVTSDPVAA